MRDDAAAFEELVANAEGAFAGLDLPPIYRLIGKTFFNKVREVADARRRLDRERDAAIANMRSRLEVLESSRLTVVSSCRLVTRAPGTADPGGKSCLTCNSTSNREEPIVCKGVTAFVVR